MPTNDSYLINYWQSLALNHQILQNHEMQGLQGAIS